ncbi:MAG TPA: sugar ABC transporter permease [bacterium]|nr:sugar ABC transporter permease [bacterium]
MRNGVSGQKRWDPEDADMGRLALTILLGTAGIPALLIGYVIGTETLLRALPQKRRPLLRSWLWLVPAFAFLGVFLIYPTLRTLYLSVFDAQSMRFVGLQNYRFALTNPAMQIAIRNNLLWLAIFTALTVGIGLVMAVLTDRVRYESAARMAMFMPMAISFVAASVIWKFVYAFRPAGDPQIGILNALLARLVSDFQPIAWLVISPLNNLALIVIGVWVWAGFCMVILSASLKGVPAGLLEAARIDGASEWQVFRRITIPILSPTIVVVVSTMVIFALKAFDIVYVMTNGNYDTDVIANRMYKEMFTFRDFGHASAIAVVLFAATLPLIVANIRRWSGGELR